LWRVWIFLPKWLEILGYNPDGQWTSTHQMTVNGKRDLFDLSDLILAGTHANLKKSKVTKILAEFCEKGWSKSNNN